MDPQERKRQILDRSAEIFARKGVTATTIREIADAVGVYSGALYHYFPSKEAIVTELIREYITDLNERCREVLARRDGTHPALTGSNGHSLVGGVVHGGECFRHAVAAFAAGDGEIAALSLAGPVEAISEDAVRRLRRAADHLETTLTA